MAAMASVTTKLRFTTGVIILPLRNPFVLAKQVATLDHMSGGRIELGVGVGWLKEEFEAVGVPVEKRRPPTDEYNAGVPNPCAQARAHIPPPFPTLDHVHPHPQHA